MFILTKFYHYFVLSKHKSYYLLQTSKYGPVKTVRCNRLEKIKLNIIVLSSNISYKEK